jgi:hypothetical protein
MIPEPSLCVVCAWRKECRKKFLRSPDAALKCADFTKDLSIKRRETKDDQTEDNKEDT